MLNWTTGGLAESWGIRSRGQAAGWPGPGFEFRRKHGKPLFSKSPERLCVPPSILFNWYRGFSSRHKATHLHLVPWLRMSGDIHLFPPYVFMRRTGTNLCLPTRQVKIQKEYIAAAKWPAVPHYTLQRCNSKYGHMDSSFLSNSKQMTGQYFKLGQCPLRPSLFPNRYSLNILPFDNKCSDTLICR